MGFGLAACVNENLIEPQPDPDDKPATSGEFREYELPGYLPVTIKMGGETTRAVGDTVVNAEESEFALAPSTDSETYHYLILYKKDENGAALNTPVAILKLDTREIRQAIDDKKDVDLTKDMTLAVKNVYGNEEFGDECKTLQGFRNYLNSLTVYALINFDPKYISLFDSGKDPSGIATVDYLKSLTISNFEKLEINDYKIKAKDFSGKEKEYFTMSSSIYLVTWWKIPSHEIDASKIYFTEEAAWEGEPAIKAEVERLAVKYELGLTYTAEGSKYLKIYEPEGHQDLYKTVHLFKMDASSGSYQFSTIPVTWSAEVVGYGMNALEPTEKLLKQIENSVNYFDNWNNINKKRSYWSKDPNYTINGSTKYGYPHQYRDALEVSNPDTIRAASNMPTIYLKYYSYNEFKNSPESTLYTIENTYNDIRDFKIESDGNDTQGIGPYNYYSAGTHYIVTCVLRLDNTTPKDLYRDDDDVYYDSRNDLITAKLTLLNYRDLIGGASDMRVLNVDWEKGLGYESSGSDHTEDLRTLSWGVDALLHIRNSDGSFKMAEVSDFDLVPAMISGGDGQVMIAPKADRRDRFYLYYKDTPTEEDPNIIEDDKNSGMYWHHISYNKLVSLFHKTMGTFDYFNQGKMYYCAPVTHTVNGVNKDSWKTVGNVGAVRNNWYKINVLGIKAPGRSVADPAQPIIPMLDNKRDYLTSQMIIFRWHEIKTGVTEYPNY